MSCFKLNQTTRYLDRIQLNHLRKWHSSILGYDALCKQQECASSKNFHNVKASPVSSSSSPATHNEPPIVDDSLTMENNEKPLAENYTSKKKKLDKTLAHQDSRSANKELSSQENTTHLCYTTGKVIPITSKLLFYKPGDDTPRGVWPVFRIMDETGILRDGNSDINKYDEYDRNISFITTKNDDTDYTNELPDSDEINNLHSLSKTLISEYPNHESYIDYSNLFKYFTKQYPDESSSENSSNISLSKNTLLRAHRQMHRLRQMDTILQNSQRQGRISFYLTCRGEEAIHIGSASALKTSDVVLAQYREAGVLMWRGFTLEQFTNQCFSNDLDLGRGRQMPIHYGSRALNYHTISSPLGTQIPQAVGVAYKMKLQKEKSIAICYFGDGAASTTDFHSALNFASTLKSPVVFFCRNNGYAISTPISEQYSGDGIVSRAPGYGMAAIRVDGNDLFAVHIATKVAREYSIHNSAPVLIEAITYRQGHHSTSDDSTRYRPAEEVLESEKKSDPVKRIDSFLQNYGWMNSNDISNINDVERMAVLKAMEKAERRPPPKLETLFTDVYHTMPAHLRLQEQKLKDHLRKYPDQY